MRLPVRTAEPAAAEAVVPDTANGYVVRSGDTLSGIANAMYGSELAWRDIYEANRDRIGDDPGRLSVGMRLSLPPRR